MTAAAAPRHHARATRETGRRTRSALLDSAVRLFGERGLAGVSLAGIAAAADAFPSQVTYYFGSKEALFVEAASREMLHAAARVEEAGHRAGSPSDYVRAMAGRALDGAALLLFADALLLCRHRPELRPLVARTVDRLHREGGRALAERCARDGWVLSAAPEAVARAFWAVLLGLVMEAAGAGAPLDATAAEAAVLGALGTRPSHTAWRT
ncbi:MAG TPA: TetR/AcrR family transcriptional regulator C-terminal domain-containing protein [Candidatus Dormibacteraeota bacterium]|jgi:AcrR family transcriptional regulator|nr:TetR/AcrR family transcriptional regulator C-terminal domain-containing protein [Candidatus Dormibacteraeota bacterium]